VPPKHITACLRPAGGWDSVDGMPSGYWLRRSAMLACVIALGSALCAQRSFRPSYDEEDNPAAMPADAQEITEWSFGRLRYNSDGGRRYRGRGAWSTDYPKADRQFVQGVRRLTRLHVKSIEQVVDIDSDEIFRVPWLYAVEVGYWTINEQQANRLREYLLRGGFLMTDDFHGTEQWENFRDVMRRLFPDRMIVDLENSHAIFHSVYDLDERFQVPGIQMFRSGRTWERDGVEPHWRGILDDRGRVMVAVCHNMDLGDAWEWADHPDYPENFASLAYRIGINYIVYSMTH
jgi:hypothetical protein